MQAPELLEKLKTGSLTLEDLEGKERLSIRMKMSLVEDQQGWYEYVDKRINHQFDTREDITEHDLYQMARVGFAEKDLARVNTAFSIHCKRTKKTTEWVQERMAQADDVEAKSLAALEVLKGYRKVDAAAYEHDIEPRTLYRYVITVARKGGLNVKGM